MPAGVVTTDSSSFRDPSGVVLIAEGRVFRTIDRVAWENLDAVLSSDVFSELVSPGRVIATWPAETDDVPPGLTDGLPPHPRRLVEHECITFISYPYEWPFSVLKRALHHLDVHLDLLEPSFTLSDASVYNVQFRGTQSVFIDALSIRPYQEGEYGTGYRQFCEQFLNPLLLVAVNGIPYQPWLSGPTYEGNADFGIAHDVTHRLDEPRSARSPIGDKD